MREFLFFTKEWAPKTGLTPTFVSYKNIADLSDRAQPTIVEVGNGLYYFDDDIDQNISYLIDSADVTIFEIERYKFKTIKLYDVRGDRQITLEVIEQSSGNPIVDTQVTVLNSNETVILGVRSTDSNGRVVIALDNASYKIRLKKQLVAFTVPEEIAVSEDATFVLEGTEVVLPIVPNPQICVFYGTLFTLTGGRITGTTIEARLNNVSSLDIVTDSKVIARSNQQGQFRLPVVRGADVTLEIKDIGFRRQITVPDQVSKNIEEYF